jgi:hypothetical protein
MSQQMVSLIWLLLSKCNCYLLLILIQLGSDGSGSHISYNRCKTSGAITAASYKVAGGTAATILKANGSLDTVLILLLLQQQI